MELLNKRAAVLKALAHPHRLCIVRGLKNNGCNVSKIQEKLGIGQSATSQHLAKLKACGVIRGIRNGKEICYEVVDPMAQAVADIMAGDIDLGDINSNKKA